MRIASLAATALVAFSSLTIAQDQIEAGTEPAPKARPINPSATIVRGRLHYDLPCRVSAVGTCITEPLPYRPTTKPD